MIKTQALSFANPFFWLIIIIVFMQYRRNIAMEEKLFGRAVNNIWLQCINSVLLGLFGGIFGSIFTCFGNFAGKCRDSIPVAYSYCFIIYSPPFSLFCLCWRACSCCSTDYQGSFAFSARPGEIEILAGLQNIHLPSSLALIGVYI